MLRRLLPIAVAGAALAAPAAASAAPNVAGSATPSTPQDCQAGCIWMLRTSCVATDPLAAQITVRCWIRSYDVATATASGPVAVVNDQTYNPPLSPFTFCVEGTARYADGTTATTTRCSASDGGAAVVAG